MANPKNKRLSQANRDQLICFARNQVAATHDSTDFDAAYSAAADAVAKACEVAYPVRDMRVLKKYEMASADRCIYVSSGGYGDFDQFEFRNDDKRIPLRPKRYRRSQPIMLEGEDAKAFAAYQKAKESDDKVRQERVNDFKALIQNATTFNGLAEIWPAIEALREEIVGSAFAVSVMSDDVLARIKKDPALSQVAA